MSIFAKDIINDINELLISFREYAEVPTLDEAVIGVISGLINIYSGMDIKKYIYPELIRQLVATSPEAPADYADVYRCRPDSELQEQLSRLLSLELPKQRSDEWYSQRLRTLGASETAPLFGFTGGFGSEKSIIRKKLGLDTDDFKPNKFTQHGVKYEPVIQEVYKQKERLNILHEFGSITHPSRPYISASPDGITEHGRMLEIKAPYQREIVGLPPNYYWSQMQQQMAVCDLDAVDFIECSIQEIPREQWIALGIPTNLSRNRNGQYRGVVRDNGDGTYDYPPLDSICTEPELNRWTWETGTYYYWTMSVYSKFTVYRDRTWWDGNVGKLEKCWITIEDYRTKPRVEQEALLAIEPRKSYSRQSIKSETSQIDNFQFIDE